MRSIGPVVLMILSALLAGGAVTGSSIDRIAHTAGPAREIAGGLPTDQDVRDALPQVMIDGIHEALPGSIEVPEMLVEPLNKASARAVEVVLDSEGFEPAWLESIDESRQAYVDRLSAVRNGAAETAPATLELGPVVDLGVEGLKEAAPGVGLGLVIDSLGQDITASVPLDLPSADPTVAQRVATTVWLAGSWGWAAVGSAILALAGLVLARPRSRGGVVALGGAVVCLWSAALLILAERLAPDGAVQASEGLGAVAGSRIMTGLAEQVQGVGTASLVGGVVVLIGGVVIRLLVGRGRNG
ncbi:MAG: hypothetical protein L0J68_03095 [Micrococcaceae bacterium]|nr:hypothetical protein [Micrococcaceae bacterium]MDN6299264.1 hypothetical protein [Micrococcaceae bacterium]